jgi:hypothetical protein
MEMRTFVQSGALVYFLACLFAPVSCFAKGGDSEMTDPTGKRKDASSERRVPKRKKNVPASEKFLAKPFPESSRLEGLPSDLLHQIAKKDSTAAIKMTQGSSWS